MFDPKEFASRFEKSRGRTPPASRPDVITFFPDNRTQGLLRELDVIAVREELEEAFRRHPQTPEPLKTELRDVLQLLETQKQSTRRERELSSQRLSESARELEAFWRAATKIADSYAAVRKQVRQSRVWMRAKLQYMKWSATACRRLSIFFEKAFVSRVKRRMLIRIVSNSGARRSLSRYALRREGGVAPGTALTKHPGRSLREAKGVSLDSVAGRREVL